MSRPVFTVETWPVAGHVLREGKCFEMAVSSRKGIQDVDMSGNPVRTAITHVDENGDTHYTDITLDQRWQT